MPQLKAMSGSAACMPTAISARILAIPAASSLWASSIGIAMPPAGGFIFVALIEEPDVIPAVPAFVQMAGSGAVSNFSCARAVPGTRISAAAKRVWIEFIRKLLSFMMLFLGVIEMCGSFHHSQHRRAARSHKAPHQQGG